MHREGPEATTNCQQQLTANSCCAPSRSNNCKPQRPPPRQHEQQPTCPNRTRQDPRNVCVSVWGASWASRGAPLSSAPSGAPASRGCLRLLVCPESLYNKGLSDLRSAWGCAVAGYSRGAQVNSGVRGQLSSPPLHRRPPLWSLVKVIKATIL